VRLDRLRENAATVQGAAGAAAGLVPMVKADAYGLGMERTLAALAGTSSPVTPWAFGVAAVSEGERLRALGWDGRVLVFSPVAPGDYSRAVAADLTLCLSELAGVRALAAVPAPEGRTVAFHVEIDTGMGRAGFDWRDAAGWGAAVLDAAGERLGWEGIFTHFQSADEPDLSATDEQWRRFRESLESLPPLEPAPLLHVANSAAILRRGGYGCNLARPGIYLYGGRAGPGVEPAPVVSVRARVVFAREVEPGATVGYGATYRARRRERWGTLAIGYGDGLPRSLSAGAGEAIVRGVRVPLIGRVSMDLTTVDLSAVPDAVVGDVATLVGQDGPGQITIDEVAQRCGTISYEILTRLGSRLPRIYLEREHQKPLPG
jgi:alanine racemase